MNLQNARTRLILISIVLSTLTTALVLGLVYVTAKRTIANETRSVVTAELAGLADDYERLGLIGLMAAIDRRSADAAERDALYLLTNPGGKVLAGNLASWPAGIAPGSGWVELDVTRYGSDTFVPVSAASLQLRRGEGLLVGRDASARQQFDRVLLRSLVLALMAAIVLSLLSGWLLTRQVFSRISDISGTAENIVSGDLTRRIPLRGTGDEFDRMATTLNEMLDRIEDLVGNLRMTTNSIAHDLRSPLSRLRQRIEALAASPSAQSAAQETADLALSEIDHLLRVFSQLTEIAHAEAGVGRENFDRVDLTALIQDVAEFYEPVAAERRIAITLDTLPCTVQANGTLIAQALSNLLENALRYAPDDSRIGISLQKRENGLILSVSDAGQGVPQDALERLSQPFVTLDPSRSDQSAGLGLALVSAIARLHGGGFEAENLKPGFRAAISMAAEV